MKIVGQKTLAEQGVPFKGVEDKKKAGNANRCGMAARCVLDFPHGQEMPGSSSQHGICNAGELQSTDTRDCMHALPASAQMLHD